MLILSEKAWGLTVQPLLLGLCSESCNMTVLGCTSRCKRLALRMHPAAGQVAEGTLAANLLVTASGRTKQDCQHQSHHRLNFK